MTSLRVGPLVRAVDATSALVWVELPHAGEVTLSATPAETSARSGYDANDAALRPYTVTVQTVKVGSRYYAAAPLTGLQPATWYQYGIYTEHNASFGNSSGRVLPLQCFRTLDAPGARRPLTLAYGSCRKLCDSRKDALGAFGSWLVRHYDQRETQWPRLLLLIGDQIYADEPSTSAVRFNAHLRGGAKNFAEFASLYEFAWTHDKNVRQALALLPTYMICDDHEITNNWNNQPFWRAALLRHQHNEQLLVDGLVAYWVYQAWGNLLTTATPALENSAPVFPSGRDASLRIMQQAARSGEDALEPLREEMRRAVYGETRLRWHYTVPTSPPLFVADARADREARFNKPLRDRPLHQPERIAARATHRVAHEETPARIMSHDQMAELKDWLSAYDAEMVMLVSSVPVLLPPIIGYAEYMMGRRIDPARSRSWRWPLRLLGHMQQKIATRTSFDHWPLFGATWKELVQLLALRRHEVLVLSGDVHFSYAMEGHLTEGASSAAGTSSSTRTNRGACLYQFVCSPFENHLGTRSRRRILAQAWRQRATYGGLTTRVRHLSGSGNRDQTRGNNKRIHHNLLFGNALATVTFQPTPNGGYQVLQKYFGSHEGQFRVIAHATFQTRRPAD